MATPSSSEPGLANIGPFPVEIDPRRVLLNRVAGCAAFQKSNRLRELLLYIGEHTFTQGDVPLREHDIGVGVFGRPADYDTSQDTLVRVQASQLRKKLQQYFEEDGRDEPIVVDLPKGSYTLLFHPRHVETAVVPIPEVAKRPYLALTAVLAAVLLVAVLVLAIQNVGLRRRVDFALGSRPTVDRLWSQIFGNGYHSYLVLADGNLVVFEDAIKQDISLSDYQNKEFRRVAERRIEDPAIRALVLNVVNRNHTSMADATVLRRMTLLFASNSLPFEVLNAREATVNEIAAHNNSILMGSRRANPWVALYEDKLNFQTVFEETPRSAHFLNRAPANGERAEYRGQWSRVGFCRVAFLSTAKGSGNVVLISGTDVPSTEAGGEFLTSEWAIRQLREKFGLDRSQEMPHFEVLLQTRLLNNTVSQFEVVAARRK